MYNKVDVTRRRSRTPSFSSTLLDSICRSIDESNGHNLTEQQQQFDFYRETTTATVKKQSHRERSAVADSWMEKQSASSSGSSIKFFTSSSISDSSSGGGVTSSSEESSCYKEKSRHCYEFSRQKPKQSVKSDDNNNKPTDSGGGFSKNKLKALKIYGELLNRKVMQPISPGGRISNFLNSIFNSSSNTKKTSMCSSSIGATEDVSSYDHPRKSKSSNSKSCLSQTPPSKRGNSKHVNGVKRSVRFYPVSVIVDEDSRPCGQKRVYKNDDPKLMPSPPSVRQKFKCSITKNIYGVNDWKSNYNHKEEEDEENEDEDDMLSCSSSDLFEIDHIVANNGRYREELPMFETTNIKTNRAIASGFIRRM